MKRLFYWCRGEPEQSQLEPLPTALVPAPPPPPAPAPAPHLGTMGGFHIERRLHECLASMASVHCICLCPLMVLRYRNRVVYFFGCLFRIQNVPPHEVARSNLQSWSKKRCPHKSTWPSHHWSLVYELICGIVALDGNNNPLTPIPRQ